MKMNNKYRKEMFFLSLFWIVLGAIWLYFGISLLFVDTGIVHIFKFPIVFNIKNIFIGIILIFIGLFFSLNKPEKVIYECVSFVFWLFSWSILWSIIYFVKYSSTSLVYFIMLDYIIFPIIIYVSIDFFKKNRIINKHDNFLTIIRRNKKRLYIEILLFNLIVYMFNSYFT